MEQVGLKEKVENFPHGLNTPLGQFDNGIQLSQGQWQRLAIARLLAKKDASIWIFDEPTAYLDPVSEVELYDLIKKLSMNRTVLFVSHRLGFAKNADRIIVFNAGKVTEDGTHDQLISQKGIYSFMYSIQESWYK